MNQGALWQVKHGKWCPLRGFDALLRGHLRPDFQSIQYLSRSAPVSQRPILDNSLDNSLGPWSEGQGPSTKVCGPRTLSRGLWTEFRGSSFAAAASWTPDQGLLGVVARTRSIWVEGWGVGSGWLLLGPWAGDGKVEAMDYNFIPRLQD